MKLACALIQKLFNRYMFSVFLINVQDFLGNTIKVGISNKILDTAARGKGTNRSPRDKNAYNLFINKWKTWGGGMENMAT